jgi:glycosyltransferase involved in cell wall biosynthesis
MKGISVVICAYNSSSRIEPTLRSLFAQHLPGVPFEIIVVDNASTDHTALLCNELRERFSFKGRFNIVTEKQSGLNYARLKGLQTSLYNWVLFCDDDNHLFPDYLQTAWNILNGNESIGALGGTGIPLFEEEEPGWFVRYGHSFATGEQSAADGKLTQKPAELYGAGTFFRKDLLLRIFENGFETIMTDRKGAQLVSGGDVEWCYLVQLAGYEIWYSSQLKFYHLMPAGRMKWEYYLRLKQGIASGTAKLYAYLPFFKTKNPSVIAFWTLYLRHSFLSLLLWIHFAIRKKIQPSYYNNEQKKLGEVVLTAKLKSFISNPLISYHHFKKLKTFI